MEEIKMIEEHKHCEICGEVNCTKTPEQHQKKIWKIVDKILTFLVISVIGGTVIWVVIEDIIK